MFDQIHELIKSRYSPRAFSDRSVPIETIRILMEAARWAASSRNEQPWRFVVAHREDDEEGFARMFDCLTPGNREWAHAAPVLVLSIASTHLARNGKPNRHARHDVGLAVSQMTFQAAAIGLMVHQMGGFDAERARTTFEIPEGFEPLTVIAVGYPGEEQRQSKPRRAQADTVFKTRFGNPL